MRKKQMTIYSRNGKVNSMAVLGFLLVSLWIVAVIVNLKGVGGRKKGTFKFDRVKAPPKKTFSRTASDAAKVKSKMAPIKKKIRSLEDLPPLRKPRKVVLVPATLNIFDFTQLPKPRPVMAQITPQKPGDQEKVVVSTDPVVQTEVVRVVTEDKGKVVVEKVSKVVPKIKIKGEIRVAGGRHYTLVNVGNSLNTASPWQIIRSSGEKSSLSSDEDSGKGVIVASDTSESTFLYKSGDNIISEDYRIRKFRAGTLELQKKPVNGLSSVWIYERRQKKGPELSPIGEAIKRNTRNFGD
ncbi:hypothetical protein ACFL35_02490 [Candidatus Riflebacteria bacterium]